MKELKDLIENGRVVSFLSYIFFTLNLIIWGSYSENFLGKRMVCLCTDNRASAWVYEYVCACMSCVCVIRGIP